MRVQWYGDKVKTTVHSAAADAMFEASEELLRLANLHVPHDVGTLELTGETDVDPIRTEASVSYDTPYAARLHEHIEYNFRGEGEGKWLENAFNNNADRLLDSVKAKIGRAL